MSLQRQHLPTSIGFRDFWYVLCMTIFPRKSRFSTSFSFSVIAGPSTVTITIGSCVGGEAFGRHWNAIQDVSSVSRCIDDQFSVTSPGNAAPPVICGTNTGDHMYVSVETGLTCSDLVFQLSAYATVTRSWAIKMGPILNVHGM